MRILPRNNDGVNEEWLADRSRYHWDGLRRQRLDRPYIRVDGRLRPASWGESFAAVARAVQAAEGGIAAVAGDLAPVEAMWALKELMAGLGSDRVECRQDGAKLPIGNRSAYAGTARIADLDRVGAVLIVGANPRNEAPVLNARIRKAWLHGAEVAMIGAAADLTFPVHHIGDRPERLTGENRDETIGFMRDKAPVVIVGRAALVRPDGAAILAHAMSLAADAGGKLLVLHTAASRVGGMDVGFAHPDGLAALEGARVIYNLGADEIDLPEGAFVVYHGSHGDRGAHRADVILPGAAYTEQSGIFVNLEGRPQMGFRANFPPGEAKEDWAILRALSAELGQTLPFDTLEELRRQMCRAHPHLGALDQVPQNEWHQLEAERIGDAPLSDLGADHYLVNPILRASELMAEMSRLSALRHAAMAAE
jgi:NADH-quinone oxidoreductase subunit G